MKYTRRERVAEALNHREPDRVPCDITIEPTSYQALCDYLGEKYEPRWWDDWNHAYPSAAVLEKLDVDVYHVPLKAAPKEFDVDKTEFKDAWGITKKKVINPDGSFMYNLMDNPLKDAECVADIESYPWPDPEEIVDVSGLSAEVKYLYDNTDFALMATFGGNVFERAHYLRGMTNFLEDLIIEPEIAQALMKKVLEIQMQVDKNVLRAAGKYLTYMRFNGEDVGTQTGQLISTDLYLREVRPNLEMEWKTAGKIFREENPGAKICMHSCGAVFDLIGIFHEMGADIVNPIQPRAKGMDTAKIKEVYGREVCFHGAVDTQEVLNKGTVEDVRAEVRRRIRDLAPGGGYICAPSHNVQAGMPVENVIAMYEAIHEFGTYPIHC